MLYNHVEILTAVAEKAIVFAGAGKRAENFLRVAQT